MGRRTHRRQRNEAGRRFREPEPAAVRDGSGPDVLSELRTLAAQRIEAEQLGAIAMHRARAAGHSWSTIGGAWGVSAQAAQQRHQRLLTMFPDIDRRLQALDAL